MCDWRQGSAHISQLNAAVLKMSLIICTFYSIVLLPRLIILLLL